MITRTFKLCLNAGTGSAPFINVSQTDKGEVWLFELYTETGERYIPSSGAIIGIKTDGHGIANTGTVDSEGRVVITETKQMTAAAGRSIFELSIDGLTHGTANFIVNVEKKPIDGAIMSDSDLSLISQAIDSAAVIVDVIGDGDPSEVIGEHVDAWLDNHPEATTTVLDGAITAPKINQSLWDKLLVSEEASGAVASFEDGADDVPVSSLKVALEPVQTGSGDPSPTNVRPISGHSSVTVEQTGRNLYPIAIGRDTWINNASGTHSTDNDVLTVNVTTATSSGVYSANSSQIWTLTPTLTGTYSYSLSAKASANGNYLIGFTGAGRDYRPVSTQWQRFTFTGTFDGTIKPFVIYGTGTASTIEIKDFMIEMGSEAHDYEPYQSASYPYTLGQSVYGGSVDLATGVLTVTHAFVSKYAADIRSTSTTGRYFTDIGTSGQFETDESNVSNWFKFLTNSSITTGQCYMQSGFRVQMQTTYATIDDFTAALGANSIDFCCKLATPITVQLTPQEVKTLLGYNNISSTGTVDVVYHADTKLYVDKMTAVDNKIIAPTEADFVATRNYTVNDLVIVADTLYKVTANIATGSAITPNSNVTQTTLSALIKALS